MHQLSHKPKNELCSWLKHGNGHFFFQAASDLQAQAVRLFVLWV